MNQEISLLEEQIKILREEKEEREAALPAHTIRPHQIMAIEALENEISQKEKQLAVLKGEFRPIY
jgi:hypothetical protein